MTTVLRSFFVPLLALFALGFISKGIAADGANPKPCKDPWECKSPPSISGEASGNSSLCANQEGTWKVEETIVKGEKTRCEEPPVEVPLRDVKWNWSITGPETHTGDGKTATKKLTKAGTYTITFGGWGYADDPCDDDNPYSCVATYSVEVKSDEWECTTPPSISGEISGRNSLCPNESGTWTVTETIIKGEKTRCSGSSAEVPLRDVKWNWSITGPETHTGDGKSVTKTLNKPGNYTITFGGFGYADSPCDKNNPYQCTVTHSVSVPQLTSVTHAAPNYQPWTAGAQISANVGIIGDLHGKEILYEVVNVDTGAVIVSKSIASTSTFLSISSPGRFRLQATLCNKTVVAGKTFVLWTTRVTPESEVVKWDKLTDIINPKEQEKVTLAELAMSQAADKAVKAADLTAKLVTETNQKVQKGNDFYVELAGIWRDNVASAQSRFDAKKAEIDALEAQEEQIKRAMDELEAKNNDLRRKRTQLSLELIDWIIIRDNPLTSPEVRQTAASNVLRVAGEIRNTDSQLANIKTQLDTLSAEKRVVAENVLSKQRQLATISSELTEAKRNSGLANGIVTDLENVAKDRSKEFNVITPKFLAVMSVASVVLGPIDDLLDIEDMRTSYSKYEEAIAEAEKEATASRNFAEQHKKALEEWEQTPVKREVPPMKVTIKIDTVPGSLPLNLLEFPKFKTKDAYLSPTEAVDVIKQRGRVISAKWPHFSFINGEKNCWDSGLARPISSAGASGTVRLEMHLLGNLGRSEIFVRVESITGPNSKAVLKSDGKTREELIELMNAQVADAKLAAERAKAKWDHILNVIGGITALFSVGLIIASAVFGAIISPILAGTLAAIGLAVAVTQICSALINWLFPVNYPIKTSITTLFPSGK